MEAVPEYFGERPAKRTREPRNPWADIFDSFDGEDTNSGAPGHPSLISEKSYDCPAHEMAEGGADGGTLRLQERLSLGPRPSSAGSLEFPAKFGSYDKPTLELAESGAGGGALRMEDMLSSLAPGPSEAGDSTSSDRVTVPVSMPRALAQYFMRGGCLDSSSATDGLSPSIDRGFDQQSCASAVDGTPSSAPAKRRQKRKGRDMPKDPLSRKRSRDAELLHRTVTVGNEASEQDWARRTNKRVQCVERVKLQPELRYQEVVESRKRATSSPPPAVPSPKTPDPHDRSISKRGWEDAIKNWKDELRLFPERLAQRPLPAPKKELWSDMVDSSEEGSEDTGCLQRAVTQA